jgi:hypothetical protein
MKTRMVVIGLLALSLVMGSSVAQDGAARNGALLFAYRTHGHIKYNKPEEFTGIVDDLIAFLKSNGVPIVNDVIHRSVATEQTTSADTLVTYLRQTGAQRLLLLTVDTPFTAKLELILRCYDPGGTLLWEERVRETTFRERIAVAQATGELHKRLGYRMQGLRDNATPSTVAPPGNGAVAQDAAARKQLAEAVRKTGDGDARFAFGLLTQQQSQQPSSLSNAHPPVAAQPALLVNTNQPVLAQTPSASTAKSISSYMRDVGLLYIETVERPSSIEQLQTLRALEDRIDIQTITQEDKQFYEGGLKQLGHLAEIRLAESQTRLAGIQSREDQARELMSSANRELDNIQERLSAEERDYSQGLITTKAYKAYLENSMALLRQKQSEARAASEALIEQEKLSQQNGSSTPYIGCDNSLRRMIKAGEYDTGELERDCGIPGAAPQRQAKPPQTPPQTLRQTILTNTNTQLQKEPGPAYAEITGNSLILHIKPMTASTFQAIFSSPEFQQFVPTMKQAGLGTLTYTNDANLLFVYDVNAGQLVVSSPATIPSKECTKATEFAAKYTRTYSNRDDCPRCSSLSQAQRDKRQAMLKAQMDAAESGRTAVCSAKTTAEVEQNWTANVENENRLLTEYRDWLVSTIGNP